MATAARDFRGTAVHALAQVDAVLAHWLPDGKISGSEYQARNPTRDDKRPGSFSVNINTGQWGDFATDDRGGDLISLIAYLDGITQGEAETRLAEFIQGNTINRGNACNTGNRENKSRKNNKLHNAAPVTPPPPPKGNACNTEHPKHGKPDAVWTYHNERGEHCFYVCRFDLADGKTIRPRHWNGTAWTWKSLPPPRPLYNLHHLTTNPNAPVLITEGEKAADAAAAMFPDWITTTTPNGAKAASKADFSPLAGRKVHIWPDNDPQGKEYADSVAKLAHEAGAGGVKVLNLDGLDVPEKGDAADVGLMPEQVANLSWLDTGEAEQSRFTVDNSGVWYLGTTKDGEALPPAWICSPLEITAMTRDENGDAWGRLLEFQDQDARPHRWAMPLELLAGDGAEYRRALLSQGLQIAPSTQARQRLTEYIQTAKVRARARCVSKTGWHGGVFVLPDTTLGERGEKVLLQSLHEPAPMTYAGTVEQWRDSLSILCSGNPRLILAVSAAFASPLLDKTGDDSGGLNFQGASSNGKTTTLHAARSVWGGPDYLQRWRATTNGLEATATAHNDALLCLDELGQVDAREAGSVAYMLANGTGKQRAKRDGLAKPKASWRLLFLSAGEIGLAQHMREAGKKARAGQEVRLADIPADADFGMFENLHGYPNGGAFADAIREAARTYYGTAAREYLKALVAMDDDKLRERLRTLRADFVIETLPDNADGQARRVCDRFALIAAGGELATGLHITGWQPGEATTAARQCFEAWINHRGGAGAQEEKAALAQVARFFEMHGESRFTPLDSDDDRVTHNRAGFRRTSGDMTEYFVLPEVWRADVCDGIDPKITTRICVDRGMLRPGSDGKSTTPHRLPGIGLRRVYHFVRTQEADNEN